MIVRTVCYNEDRARLSLKLMAGDGDIDIFSTVGIDGYLFAASHMYADLKGFPGLRDRISSNILADFASDFGGEYIGLPYGVRLEKDCQENVS